MESGRYPGRIGLEIGTRREFPDRWVVPVREVLKHVVVNASGVSESAAGGDLFEDLVFLLGGCGLIEDDKRMEEARFVFVEVKGSRDGFDARVAEVSFAVHDEFNEVWRAEACAASEIAK